MTAKQLTHDELAFDLAGYLAGPSMMVWTDMQLGPSGSPRPDVYTIRKSYSKPMPMAFECKVSRSDLRSDTTSGKWQSYLKFAAAVVFAAPDGLCTVADIPDGCGLIVRKAAAWRYVRRPTLQNVVPPFDACMKLLIDGVHRAYVPRSPIPRAATTWELNARVRAKFGEAVATAARDLAAAQSRIDNLKSDAAAAWAVEKKGIDTRAEILRSQYAASEAEWASIRAEVREWLGIEGGSTFAARQKLAALRAECSVDARVDAAEKRLTQARLALDSAVRAITPMDVL